MQTMSIGRLAELARVNIDTIRYYERQGLLPLTADRAADMQGVKRKAEARLDQVEQKIAELQRVKRGLKQLIDACPGKGELACCPIVAALSGAEARGEDK